MTDRMSELVSETITGAVARVLGENDAMLVDYIGFVRYMRLDPEGDGTGRYWACVTSPGLDQFALSGMAAAVSAWAESSMVDALGLEPFT